MSPRAAIIILDADLDRAIRAAFEASEGPISPSDLRKRLPAACRSAPRVLERLRAFAAAGEIFAWPKGRFARRPFEEALTAAVARWPADTPATAEVILRGLPRSLAATKTAVAAVLEQRVAAGGLFAYASARGVRRFLGRAPDVVARAAVVAAIAGRPRSEAEVVTAVQKQLPEYPVPACVAILQGLRVERQAFLHPKHGRQRAAWGAAPPDPAPYLVRAQKEIDAVAALLAGAGVDRATILRSLAGSPAPDSEAVRALSTTGPKSSGNGSGLEPAGPLPPALSDEALLAAIMAVRPDAPHRVLVSLRDLRRRLPMPKSDFDEAILSFARRGRAVLHHHDHAAGLSDSDREALVTDGRGRHFIGLVLKEGTP